LNSFSHPGNRTLTTPTIERITSIYNQMKSNNSTGGFTQIASVAMQTLDKRSFFDGAGRKIAVVPNSLDFSNTLKFGTLGAEFVCGIGPLARQPIIRDK
jgi:type IV secretory pathway VirB6-like protein